LTCFAVVKEFSAYIQLVCFNEVDIRVQNILNECDCNVLVFSIPASYVVYEVYVCVCVCMCVYIFIYIWSSVLAFSIQVCGFKPGRSRRIFNGEKILSTPSFGGEV